MNRAVGEKINLLKQLSQEILVNRIVKNIFNLLQASQNILDWIVEEDGCRIESYYVTRYF